MIVIQLIIDLIPLFFSISNIYKQLINKNIIVQNTLSIASYILSHF